MWNNKSKRKKKEFLLMGNWQSVSGHKKRNNDTLKSSNSSKTG